MEIKTEISLGDISIEDEEVRKTVMDALKHKIWVEVSKQCEIDYQVKESVQRIAEMAGKLTLRKTTEIEYLLARMIDIVRKPDENKQIHG